MKVWEICKHRQPVAAQEGVVLGCLPFVQELMHCGGTSHMVFMATFEFIKKTHY